MEDAEVFIGEIIESSNSSTTNYCKRFVWVAPLLATIVAIAMVILSIYLEIIPMIIFFSFLLVLFLYSLVYYWYHDVKEFLEGGTLPADTTQTSSDSRDDQQRANWETGNARGSSVPTSTTIPVPQVRVQVDTDKPPDYSEAIRTSKADQSCSGDCSKNSSFKTDLRRFSSMTPEDPKRVSIYYVQHSVTHNTPPMPTTHRCCKSAASERDLTSMTNCCPSDFDQKRMYPSVADLHSHEVITEKPMTEKPMTEKTMIEKPMTETTPPPTAPPLGVTGHYSFYGKQFQNVHAMAGASSSMDGQEGVALEDTTKKPSDTTMNPSEEVQENASTYFVGDGDSQSSVSISHSGNGFYPPLPDPNDTAPSNGKF